MHGDGSFHRAGVGPARHRRAWPRRSTSRKKTRESSQRYGTGDPNIFIDGNGAPRVPQSLLMARRLIEAGARVVTLNYSKWDWHGGDPYRQHLLARGGGFSRLRPVRQRARRGSAPARTRQGLHRGHLGEFGRTPKISPQVGRDHWPQVNFALLAGGGMRTGQVIGATDRIAGEAVSRPVTFGEVYATLFHHLGIDASQTTLPDLNGRPQYLVEDHAKPIPELG